MWQAVIYAWRDADVMQLTALGGFAVVSAWAMVQGVYRWLLSKQMDYEPRATPSERGLW